MTISYQRDVASSTAGGFTRLLFKWKERGSSHSSLFLHSCIFKKTFSSFPKHLHLIQFSNNLKVVSNSLRHLNFKVTAL
jgi:hypothetical protein